MPVGMNVRLSALSVYICGPVMDCDLSRVFSTTLQNDSWDRLQHACDPVQGEKGVKIRKRTIFTESNSAHCACTVKQKGNDKNDKTKGASY